MEKFSVCIRLFFFFLSHLNPFFSLFVVSAEVTFSDQDILSGEPIADFC